MPNYNRDSFLTFRGIAVPQGAVIDKAVIEFWPSITTPTSPTPGSGTVNALIDAHCSEDSSAPEDGSDIAWNMGDRTATAVEWDDVSPWTIGTMETSPNIACVIQELVNLEGWNSGNTITLFINNNGSDGSSFRYAVDWNDDDSKAANLKIWYHLENVETPSGGIIWGGSATITNTYGWNPSGGIEWGGSSSPNRDYVEDVAGGISWNGTASAATNMKPRISGGISWNSRVDEVVGVAITDGGMSYGGTVDAVVLYGFNPSGGVTWGNAVWSNGYAYRTTITVPAGAVERDFEKFYLALNVDLEPAHSYTGSDFYVTNSDDEALEFELRNWDEDTGRLHIFVKTPLVSESDNVFFIYSGRES